MPRSCVYMYGHFVWRTWDRLPLIVPDWEDQLHACVAEAVRDIGCGAFRVGGTDDHVHALVRMGTTVTIAQIAQQMKGESSHLVTHRLAPGTFFKWQGTYGAFSVDPADIDRVIDYIAHQREHHAADTTIADWERCDELDLPT